MGKVSNSPIPLMRTIMNQQPVFEESALWTQLIDIQKTLEEQYVRALKIRRLSALGSMAAPLRKMHWAAAFLGLTDMANLCAAAAAFVRQLQENRFRWSVEIASAVKRILKRTRNFIEARPDTPPSGVFIDSSTAVLQSPELRRPIPVDDLLSMFRKRQIDSASLSGCRRIAIGPDADFSHAINLPKNSGAAHRAECYLTLVYMDLSEQESHTALSETLEAAFRQKEILLHGPLGIPWKKYQTRKACSPYYLLLDTPEEAVTWLNNRDLKARPVKVLRTPKIQQEEPPRVIVQAAPEPLSEPETLLETETETEEVITRNKKPPKAVSARALGVRFSVGMKLIIIVSAIIILAMSTMTYTALYFFKREIRNRVDDTNISMSRMVAAQADKEIVSLFNSANLLFQVSTASADSPELTNAFFSNYSSLIYVGVPGSQYNYLNRHWFHSNRIFNETQVLQNVLDERSAELEKARTGENVVINVSPYIPNLKSPVLALAAPFLLGTNEEILVILADVGSTLAESVQSKRGFTTTVIINSNGELLIHPETDRIMEGDNLQDSPVFQQMYTQGLPAGQIHYKESTDSKQSFVGSFSIIPTGNLGVITTVPEKKAFQILRWIQKLNIYLLGTILSLSILAVYFFSRSLSKPIKELALATRQIKAHNYSIYLTPKGHDEVGQLTRNFMSMIPQLKKVDRLQEKTSQFVNTQVARMIAENNLPERATTRDVTVFFSDIRNFTAMSESMNDPQLVMDNLSEYFQAMVPCVHETLGTVDKFIGDALMAVWGSMNDLPNNAENAVNGALMMREALVRFNAGRGGTHHPVFSIGCGLHSGPATVGLMGGRSAKLEWAHMGDTVNLASRIEALNKPMGTDILVSQATAERVKDIFQLVPMPPVMVKGKAEPQQIYAVLGRLDDTQRPKTLDALRSRLGISPSPEIKNGMDSHETKYEILDS